MMHGSLRCISTGRLQPLSQRHVVHPPALPAPVDDAARADVVDVPAGPVVQPRAVPTRTVRSADSLLEDEAEALNRKAIRMALSGHAPSLRLCFDRLATLRKDRSIPNVLPEITGPEDLPKATRALLRAVAASEITPAEAAALAKLVDTHMRSIEASDSAHRSPQTPDLEITEEMSEKEAMKIYATLMRNR